MERRAAQKGKLGAAERSVNCLDENDALELLTGAAASPGVRQRRAHLETCPACEALVLELARALLPGDAEGHWGRAEDSIPAVGTLVGRYRVEGQLGRGAMGVVLAAHDTKLGRMVALKLLRPGVAADAVARLRREAKILAAIQHASVVEVHCVGETVWGPFVVMELLDGADIRQWWTSSTRSAAEILDVFRKAGEGVAAAHRAGVVHRDLKPQNIVVTSAGRVVVVDFGLGALADRTLSAPTPNPQEVALDITRSSSGVFVGTPAYAAPEVLEGARASPLSDQYSFCLSLREALAAAGREGPPVSARIRRALERGSSRLPDARFDSMTSLMKRLAPVPSRVKAGVAAAGVGIGAVALSWAIALPPAACDPQSEVAGLWDSPRRVRLRTKAGPDASWERRLEPAIDGYVESWTEARELSCAEEGLADLDRERVCLRRARDGLGGLLDGLEQLAESSIKDVAPLVEAIGALPDPHGCNVWSLEPLDRPADARLAGRLAAIRGEAIAANSASDRARLGDALVELDALARDAERTDARAVQASARYMQGIVQNQRGDYTRSTILFEEAFFLATAADYREAAFESATSLTFNNAVALGEIERAELWFARAEEHHDPTDLDEQNEVAMWAAELSLAHGDLVGAFERYNTMVERLDDLGSSHDGLRHETLSGRATVRSQLGDLAGCLTDFEAALEAGQRALGAAHPDLARPLNGLAICHLQLGQPERAEPFLLRAIEAETKRGNGLRLAYMLANLGLMYVDLGRREEGIAKVERAQELYARVGGAAHPEAEELAAVLEELREGGAAH